MGILLHLPLTAVHVTLKAVPGLPVAGGSGYGDYWLLVFDSTSMYLMVYIYADDS